jgi:hypothetical protein
MTHEILTYLSTGAALFSLALGFLGFVRPLAALELVGLKLDTALPHSISEVRATYGGVFIGASLYPLVSGEPHAYLALASAWLLAGICRLCSAILDGAADRFNLTSIMFEATIGILIALPYLGLV